MKSVLITGSEGFLGRHLVRRLLDAGCTVHGVDLSGASQQHDRYRVENINVLDAEPVEAFVANVSPDAIVHLAALTTHDEIVNRKAETLKLNMQGTVNLLDACKRCGAGRFLYASTGKVYGRIEDLPISEDHPTNPLNILGKTKIIAEKLIDFYSLDCPARMVILRIFNVYGPGQRDYFLVPTILSQLAEGNLPVTLGNVEDKRDYIYVEDVADAIAFLLDQHFEQPVEVFNLGSGRAHSAANIVRVIGEIVSRQINVSVDASRFRKDECPVEYADTRKLSALGWRPRYSLREGLEKTVLATLGESCK